jgi:N-acetylglucosamine kinase-like BadF-type ATPase
VDHETAAVLAIDAGNSKTDVAIVLADGTVRGTARGGSFRPDRLGAAPAVAGLAPLVDKARAAAGLDGDGPFARHVSACLANADLPIEHEALESAIRAQGWGGSIEVFNDTFALLRAGLDEPRGVAVVCGAGINCAGLLPDGTTARFAAVGHISGDWGGGGNLWQEAMWWAARAMDGRGPATALSDALPHHAGLATMDELIEAVHLGRLSEAECRELTPVLFAVAADGDEVATDLVRRQA